MSVFHIATPYGLRLAMVLVVALALTSVPACDKCNGDVTVHVTGPATMHVGAVAKLGVMETYTDGSSSPWQPSAHTIFWESSDTGVVTVSVDGVVSAIAQGTATVTGTPLVICTGAVDRTPGTVTIAVVP